MGIASTAPNPRQVGPWRDAVWPALACLALVTASAALCWAVRPALADVQHELLRRHVARLDAAAPAPTQVAASPARDPRDVWRDALPSTDRREDSLARLASLAAQAGLAIDATTPVRDEPVEPALRRLQVEWRLQARYPQVRALLAHVLEAMPHVSLDQVELEPAATAAAHATPVPALRCRLRWSVYLRQLGS